MVDNLSHLDILIHYIDKLFVMAVVTKNEFLTWSTITRIYYL